MLRLLVMSLLLVGLATTASADIWRWVDANGDTHFVDSNRPIYTWRDQYGKVHYADKPGHEDAIKVQLVWHAEGSLDELQPGAAAEKEDANAYAGETAEQRAERQAAEAYYCKRANEILDSYLNAPQLYRTGASGEREILSDAEMAATIADAKSKTKELCGQ